jgi:intracellular sulfur oxidation DsrE/DsrF family protein
MKRTTQLYIRHFFAITLISFFSLFIAMPAASEEYAALDGVNDVKAVFDFTLGDPKNANVVIWAVRNVYENESVRALPEAPRIAVVFHGYAVKLVSSDNEEFSASDKAAVNEFKETVRQMKKDGVTFEICLYAAKVLDVDPASIMAEVDRVGNGFISVVGYQAQGYSLVTID